MAKEEEEEEEEEEEGSFDSKSGRHYTLVCSFSGSLAGTTTTYYGT